MTSAQPERERRAHTRCPEEKRFTSDRSNVRARAHTHAHALTQQTHTHSDIICSLTFVTKQKHVGICKNTDTETRKPFWCPRGESDPTSSHERADRHAPLTVPRLRGDPAGFLFWKGPSIINSPPAVRIRPHSDR